MLGLLVHKCINGTAPNYLGDMFTPMRDIHAYHTRNDILQVPVYHSNFMKRSFAYCGTVLWNSFPPRLRDTYSINVFKGLLRAHINSHF